MQDPAAFVLMTIGSGVLWFIIALAFRWWLDRPLAARESAGDEYDDPPDDHLPPYPGDTRTFVTVPMQALPADDPPPYDAPAAAHRSSSV